METIQETDQERVHRFLLRVCTGKKNQAEAKTVAEFLTDAQAAVTMSFLSSYGVPEKILISKGIEHKMSFGSFNAKALRTMACTVPVLTAFGVESDLALMYLKSVTGAADRHIDKDGGEHIARGMVASFLVGNNGTLEIDHLKWVGENAEELGKHVQFLQSHRSASRHICNLALSGVYGDVSVPLSEGAL